MNEQMKERVRDVLTSLTRYRSKHLEDKRIEEIVTQLELIQSAIESGRMLAHAEKEALDFNLIEGTPLEHDEHLVTELYSIKNFAMNTL